VQTALSGFSTASFIYDQWNGLPYYQKALQWIKEGAKPLIHRLDLLQKKLFSAPAPDLVLSCEALAAPSLHYKGGSTPPWKGDYKVEMPSSQVRFIASPVAFTACGLKTISYHHPDAPLLFLVAELLDNLFLHKEIREKGGAYGGGASYAPSTGNFHFFAYRDPHLAKTLEIFPQSLKILAQGKFTEQELEEAKLGVIQTLDAPVIPASRAMVAYAWKRAGRTLKMRQEFRDILLSATRTHVVRSLEEHLLNKPLITVSLLGQELYEKEQKKLKTPLQLLSI
jgi:Zn-dependent M16 (insulinase) family peptidase